MNATHCCEGMHSRSSAMQWGIVPYVVRSRPEHEHVFGTSDPFPMNIERLPPRRKTLLLFKLEEEGFYGPLKSGAPFNWRKNPGKYPDENPGESAQFEREICTHISFWYLDFLLLLFVDRKVVGHLARIFFLCNWIRPLVWFTERVFQHFDWTHSDFCRSLLNHVILDIRAPSKPCFDLEESRIMKEEVEGACFSVKLS